MCGFIFSQKELNNIDEINEYCRFRGPDATNIIYKNKNTFVHNLLSITGPPTIQPYVDNDLLCMYNGEIYNANGYDNDGQCLLDFYKNDGFQFVKKLDGEFALVLIDYSKNIILLSSDTFGTKPLWYCLKPFISAASYASCLKSVGGELFRLDPNKTVVFNLDTGEKVYEQEITLWDLKQNHNSYDQWFELFQKSIKKRTSTCKRKIFVGLSSGYDSGAIACECSQQAVDFKCYSVSGNENEEILKERSKWHNVDIIHPTQEQLERVQNHISANVEDVHCNSFGVKGYAVKKDKASIGLGVVCEYAKKDNRVVYLSGQGADEIISDYGMNGKKLYRHSQFSGVFPKDLTTIFPWRSFYGCTQNWYLTKEEFIAGSYGIEARYPFLDVDLVREYLKLSPKLKNKNYKAPIYEYLKKHGYPSLFDSKIGFNYRRSKQK